MLNLNQKGLSPLTLLFFIVLGVFILWETNEFVGLYTASNSTDAPGLSDDGPICKSGEEGNCNDSNDIFLLSE